MYEANEHWKQYKQEKELQNKIAQEFELFNECGFQYKAKAKQETVSYNHDEVYNTHKEKFENMNCFNKYKSYTSSNNIPLFCRNLNLNNQ